MRAVDDFYRLIEAYEVRKSKYFCGFLASEVLNAISGCFRKQVFTQMPAREERHFKAPSRCMIRELRDGDVEEYVKLRREALLDSPLAFASSPADDLYSSAEPVPEELRRAPESVIIGAFRPNLIGALGLYRDRHLKSSHKVHLWGLYVTPGHRRQGVASDLLKAVLRHAAGIPGVSWVHLKVSAATPGAQRLYERVGFRVWGTEPAGARYDGQTVADNHMALCLEPDAG